MQKNKRSFGTEGETIAADFLTNNNYKIIKRNFRAGKIGEIDIIARENEYYCFVEVKTRTSTEFGMPSEAVNTRKQKRIKTLAYIYTSLNKLYDCNIRFDIVEILFENKEKYSINVIKNAF